MLKLNASVHSWLTRQEIQKSKALEAEELLEFSQEKSAQSELSYFVDDELHKHLKADVSEMYGTWDEADLRIRNRLENLTTSLVAWKQFENGLNEFTESLGKDRGALFGLKGAIEDGRTSDDLVGNVQQVAKLLSEKLENQIQKNINMKDDLTQLNQLQPELAALQFMGLKSLSNAGSLSDSGFSDAGGLSDGGGMSERERRLGVLRRLAKQLVSTLLLH